MPIGTITEMFSDICNKCSFLESKILEISNKITKLEEIIDHMARCINSSTAMHTQRTVQSQNINPVQQTAQAVNFSGAPFGGFGNGTAFTFGASNTRSAFTNTTTMPRNPFGIPSVQQPKPCSDDPKKKEKCTCGCQDAKGINTRAISVDSDDNEEQEQSQHHNRRRDRE